MLIVHGRVKTFGIFDRHLVGDRVRVLQRVALDEVKCLAVKVARLVEPGAVVVILDVHDERVAFPAAARVAHPEVDAFQSRRAVRVDRAMHLRPLERHRDVVGRLEDLERELHVHDSRHARQVTLRQRVGGQAILRVLDLLLRRPVLVRESVRPARRLCRPAGRNARRDLRDRRLHGCGPARSPRGRACRQQSVE